MSLPGLMKYVRVLETAGLVTTERIGRKRQCRLGPEHLDEAVRWIERYRLGWEQRLDRFEGYLDKKKGASA
jgi:DNA-binding transcriptional ArsR family regulator